MIYKTHYDSPLGGILLLADEKGLTGLWFDGQKYYAQGQADLEPEAGAAICNAPCEEEHAPLLADVKRWLDIYFAGKEPDFDLPLNPTGTDFQKSVWSILCTIPLRQDHDLRAGSRRKSRQSGVLRGCQRRPSAGRSGIIH